MAAIITTFIGEPDVFNTVHQIGAILVFILGILLLGFYIKNKMKKSKKSPAKETEMNEQYVTAMILFLCIAITVFIDGLIEIIAGILAIIIIIWHVKTYD